MHSAPQIIFTAQPASAEIALKEVRKFDPQADLIEWLEPGLGRVSCSIEWGQFAQLVQRDPPIFIRHFQPVQAEVYLSGFEYDLELLEAAAADFQPRLAGAAFSVQTRLVGRSARAYRPFDVNQRLAAFLQAAGGRLDVRSPQQVCSLVCTLEKGYLGYSTAGQNLSSWAGGARRFKRQPGQISRAEFKLLEAEQVFALDLPEGGHVLDIGAAPGGWTRIMLARGSRVTAVDPAELDARLRDRPGLVHLRRRIQAFQPAGQPFDLVLNDMRMQASASAAVMRIAREWLRPAGLALMTLKLPQEDIEAVVHSCLDELRQDYRLLGARQLFHNRQEVSVALQAPASP